MYKTALFTFGNGNHLEWWRVLRRDVNDPVGAKLLMISYHVICVPSGRKYTGRVFAWVNVSTSFS